MSRRCSRISKSSRPRRRSGQRCAAGSSRPDSTITPRTFYIVSAIVALVAAGGCLLAKQLLLIALLAALRLRARPAALGSRVPEGAAREGLHRRIRQCHRRHRAQREVGPADQRSAQDRGAGIAAAGSRRVRAPGRRAEGRRHAGSGPQAHVRPHADGRGQLLRHRDDDPGQVRRQSVRGAEQPRQRAARPQSACRARSRRCRRKPRPRR